MCGHCGNLSKRTVRPWFPLFFFILCAVLLYHISVRFFNGLFWIEMLFAAGFLMMAIAIFITYTQPFVPLEARDGKAHDFYELKIRIEWEKPGRRKGLLLRGLRIKAGKVFVIDNATVTEGGIKPFVIIHYFNKFTGMTRAKIRVPAKICVGETFALLVNGNAVALYRRIEDRA